MQRTTFIVMLIHASTFLCSKLFCPVAANSLSSERTCAAFSRRDASEPECVVNMKLERSARVWSKVMYWHGTQTGLTAQFVLQFSAAASPKPRRERGHVPEIPVISFTNLNVPHEKA